LRAGGRPGDAGRVIDVPTPREDRRVSFAIFAFVFVLNAWFFGGGGWNQNASIDLTRAVVERGELSIDAFASNTGDRSYWNGRVYANKAPGLSFAAVPVWTLVRAVGADLADPVTLSFAVWFVTVILCATSGAAIAAMLYLAGRGRDHEPRWCAAIAVAASLATPVFAFSTLFFAHVPSAALLFAAFLMVTGSRPRPASAGLAAGCSVAMNYLAGPAALLAAIPLLGRERRWRSMGAYALGGVAPALAVAAYQAAAFGSPLRTPIAAMDERFVSPTARWLGIFEPPRMDALFGITLSPYRGLFWVSPFLVLALLGLRRSWRRSALETAAAAAIVLFFVAANASFNGWEGGFSFGPRYLIPAVPFLALVLLDARSIPRLLLAGLIAISCANNAVAVAVDPQPSGSIAHPLRDYLYPVLVAGEVPEGVVVMPQWPSSLLRGRVAINPHTIDQAIPFTKHEPGSRASTWASFNLGELVSGAGSAWSLLFPLLWFAGGGWWIVRRATRSSR
jgi:hypothetical protein